MKINNLEIFKDTIKKRMAFGTCISLADATISELAADAGFDFCWIDMEHGVMSITDLMHHVMALRGTNCAAFVRVPDSSHTSIKKVIDLAPAGIIAPMINSADAAREIVRACRFPMDGGSRGYGPRRGCLYGNMPAAQFLETAKREPWVIPQIEHIEAYEKLDEILDVEGIECICIGPYDLSCSINKPGMMHDPEVMRILDDICRRAKAKGKIVGAFGGTDYAEWKNRGADWISICFDEGAISSMYRAMLSEARKNA